MRNPIKPASDSQYRPPPADTDAEMATLGSMLLDASMIDAVLAVLPTPAAFFDVAHRTIFAEIRALHAYGKPMDLVVVEDYLRTKGQLESVGGRDHLITLVESTPSAVNATFYAGIVRDKYRHRQAITLGGRLREAGYAGNGELDAALAAVTALACTPGPPSDSPMKSITIEGLLTESVESVEWLVDGLLPVGGLSLLVSKPKVGKSTLARHLSLAVARSERFLGRACRGGLVLLVSLEDRREAVADHFRRLGAEHETVSIVTERPLTRCTDAAVAALAAEIRRAGAALCVIDTLARFVSIDDLNDYAQVQRAVGPLLDLSRKTGCHVMLCHHCGKSERADGDSVLGSTALFGIVDVVLTLKRNAQNQRTLSSVARYGSDWEPTTVSLDAETGAVEATGSIQPVRQADLGRKILAVLAGSPGLTEPEIRKAVGGSFQAVHDALQELAESRAVKRTGPGTRGKPFRFSTLNSPLAHVRQFES